MNILINRTDAIGVTILTLPMARAIKKHLPDAKIVFLVSPKSQDLFAGTAEVDEVVVLEKKGGSIGQFFQLRKALARPWQAYFYIGGSHIPSFWAYFRRIKIRGGIKSRWPSFLFLNKSLRQRRSLVEMHELEYNLASLAALGIRLGHVEMKEYFPQLKVSDEEKKNSWKIFLQDLQKEGQEPREKLIWIHPGMTGHTLNWPVTNYARLIIRLEELYAEKILFVVSYTPSDEGQLVELRKEMGKNEYAGFKKNVYFMNGATHGLRHTMALIARANVLIGPSTGPTHIAAALGTPVVALYSPIRAQSSARWGPRGPSPDKIKVVVPDVICGEVIKCALDSCPYYKCMEQIDVDDVVAPITEFLKLPGSGV
ncbi:MAG: glycosyltransferase family 9 protein [Pseudomonadota bacterium]